MSQGYEATNVRTTVSPFGLATSFRQGGEQYLISTVTKNGYFETIIKQRPLGKVLYRSQRKTQTLAVLEHIATARMAFNHHPISWTGTAKWEWDTQNVDASISEWRAPRIINIIQSAGINYVEPKKSWSLFFFCFVVVIFLLIIFSR